MCNVLATKLSLFAAFVILLMSSLSVLADGTVRVCTAKSVITMDESLPRAEAVAVADGRIVAVGSIDSMQPWLNARPHVVDERFADKVIVLGLIDNHLHPQLAALLLNTVWITPHEWAC